MCAESPLCSGRPGPPDPLVAGSWLGVGAGLCPSCLPGLSLAFPPGTSGQTGQVGFHISSSLPHLSGDCVRVSVSLCVHEYVLYVSLCMCDPEFVYVWFCVRVSVRVQQAQQARWPLWL